MLANGYAMEGLIGKRRLRASWRTQSKQQQKKQAGTTHGRLIVLAETGRTQKRSLSLEKRIPFALFLNGRRWAVAGDHDGCAGKDEQLLMD